MPRTIQLTGGRPEGDFALFDLQCRFDLCHRGSTLGLLVPRLPQQFAQNGGKPSACGTKAGSELAFDDALFVFWRRKEMKGWLQ